MNPESYPQPPATPAKGFQPSRDRFQIGQRIRQDDSGNHRRSKTHADHFPVFDHIHKYLEHWHRQWESQTRSSMIVNPLESHRARMLPLLSAFVKGSALVLAFVTRP